MLGGGVTKVGFVGAGRVGCSLGKYLSAYQEIVGYYSRTSQSAIKAAEFTKSDYFKNLETLISESDTVFITVPDDAIGQVWEQIKHMPIAGKLICHCSGSLSSKIFSDIEETGATGFSVHPLLAVSDRYNSYQEISNALFTIEGEKDTAVIKALLEDAGLTVVEISGEIKTKYHASAVFASNLVVGVLDAAFNELKACGFSDELSRKALKPLIMGNVEKVLDVGTKDALTGPVARNDVGTVKRHLSAIQGEDKESYVALSKRVLMVAKEKNPQCDYKALEDLLNQEDL